MGAADRPVRLRIVAAMLLGVAGAGIAALAPLSLKYVVDGIEAGRPSGAIVILVAAYLSALLAGRLAGQGQAYLFAVGEQRLQQRLSAGNFRHILRLPMSFHLDRRAGWIWQANATALHGARLVLLHLTTTLLPVAAQIGVMVLVVANVTSIAAASIIAATAALYALIFALAARWQSEPAAGAVEAEARAGGVFGDALASIDAVKNFGAEERLCGEYEKLVGESASHWRRSHLRRAAVGVLVALVFVASSTAMLALVLAGSFGEQRMIGNLVLLTAYMIQILGPLEAAGFALQDLAQTTKYFGEWKTILRIVPEPLSSEAPTSPGRVAAGAAPALAVRFEDVTLTYGAGRPPALTSVTFEIAAGEIVAVVGPSGAGKSSLLRLLLRYRDPDAGCVLVDGVATQDWDLASLRRSIAVVSQDAVLLNTTLRENLLFARPDAGPDHLASVLDAASLQDVVRRLPQGLDSAVGERGLALSGGERQRVAIARALLREAPILACDEPTSALDPATGKCVGDAILSAAQGRTCFVVTHRLELAARAHRILVLDHGRLVEQGAHTALVSADGRYAQLWRKRMASVGFAAQPDGQPEPADG
jgi:ATP-binding cassette subfamily B protein